MNINYGDADRLYFDVSKESLVLCGICEKYQMTECSEVNGVCDSCCVFKGCEMHVWED